MALDKLLTPVRAGNLELANRVFMAPLTRSRAAQPGDLPAELNATYYAQRASAGLIVTEATQISRQGQGYAWTPGIYTDAQEAGWKNVVSKVHQAGGAISLQLWHVGRISNRLLQENGAAPVAPSAIQAATSHTFVVHPDGTTGNAPTDTPRALETGELAGIVADYAAAARRAVRAGFDFVEIHAANGYLLHQFLATGTNQRTDNYGGSLENRARLLLEVVDAIAAEIGAHKVGVRLSPNFTYHDISDSESEQSALYVAAAFSQRKLAYLHIAEPDWTGGAPLSQDFRNALRTTFNGTLIYCGNYTAEKAEAVIAAGGADAIAFGRPYIANPDLVTRFAKGADLNTPDQGTFYGGAEHGYTDYPTLTA
ncbi:N-ethylmaleimide reductase [Andreprevotia sp. IGB-42]|uniref:alkene reductase n=1 Tax=Andreprevotia sp. IGB-42 TaxID=2497473 RepID=UPI00135C749D|nr:alkene reductase [Andreprevotia sp. IGB-42]KAF0811528.1 N-ethylmaleimide reductase [Andreprevotia sp. IGB-42]